MRLIGITMREFTHSPTSGVADTHDALSHHWGRFCAMAGLAWIPLPNRGEETLALATHLNLAGIILTGGGDVGKQPCRDSTEQVLLSWAQAAGRPVLGVSRLPIYSMCLGWTSYALRSPKTRSPKPHREMAAFQ